MAPTFVFKFTAAQAAQIESYINHRHQGRDAGWYYGNRVQFEERESQIMNELAERRTNTTVLIP
jgi:hypothetical protein